MTENTAIVWNPSKTTREVLEAAVPEGIDVSWFETAEDDPGRGATQAALAAGAGLILAAGGDGTIRAVAEHLAETGASAELGIVPLGTGNLLARNLGVPVNNVAAAISRAFDNQPTTIDIGWADVHVSGDDVQRRAFAVMAGFGIDAHMITETNDDLKDRAGWLAYVESLGRALSASAVIDIRLSVDGGETVRDRAHTLLVGNCGMLQGGIALLPDADPSDGELDLLVLQADGVAGWLDTMRNMMWDHGIKRLFARDATSDDAGSASTIRGRLTTLTVDLAEPRMFEVDGDTVGEATRVEISIQPAALRVR